MPLAQPRPSPAIEIATASHAGGRSRNEDDLRTGEGRGATFAVLSDGAGGHRDGAVASDIVVRMLALALQQAVPPSSMALAQALEQANRALADLQEGQPSSQRMHATVVALWLDTERGRAWWAHVGDSRLYLLRRGEVKQLTRDHSLVQQLVDAGLLSDDDAKHHPKRNQLMVALGVSHIETGACVSREGLAAEDGDAFLLCTDGWWGALEQGDIDTALARADSAEVWLADMAATIAARAGKEHDNYSAIAVWVGDPREVTRFG
jgi:PPM family protein phosphatase